MTTGPDWDHSGLAQEVELDEATIRACIAAVPLAKPGVYKSDDPEVFRADALQACREALEALLPKDRAKEIVEAYREALKKGIVGTWPLGGIPEGFAEEARFARYLIKEGMLK